MGKGTGSCQACKKILYNMASLLGSNSFYKISSLVSSIMTFGFVLNIHYEELLKYAESIRNRCLGTTLDLFTHLLPYSESRSGRIFLLCILSASLAVSYLIKQEIVEAQELGATLLVTIVVVVVTVAVHVGAPKVIWICMQ